MSENQAAAPWWERLPDDFYLQTGGTEIDHLNRMQIYSTAALDRLVRSGLGSMLAAAFAPMAAMPWVMKKELARADFYRELADNGDADAIFVRPPEVQVQSTKPHRFAYKPKGIPAEALSFTSPFVPQHPDLRSTYAKHRNNRTAHAQYWTHPDGPRPTLIFLHGIYLNDYAVNSRMFALPWFYKQGFDILMPTMPFHGRRKERLDPFSGFGWFGHGLSSLNEATFQAVCDTRVWIDYLEQRGAPSTGVSGLSLGGYVSSILPNVDDRLAFCIPNSPVVTLMDMAMEWSPIGEAMRAAMRVYGFSLSGQRHALASHSPLTFTPKIDPERLMVIGGAGDRFTAPRFVRLLHEHWQGSRLLWFPGNHVIHLGQGEYLRAMRDFMRHNCAMD